MASPRSMKVFFLLMSICLISTAFSSTFTARRNMFTSPPNHLGHGLHLRIPRGGQSDVSADDDLLDLDSPADSIEETVAIPADDVQVDTKVPEQLEVTKGASSVVGMLSPLTAALSCLGSSYSAALVARPILTKSLTAGLTFFLSDYCAQQIEKPKEQAGAVEDSSTTKKSKKAAKVPAWKHDWMRTLVSCAVGLFYFGPAASAWYDWIFHVLPGTSLVSTIQKAALGQMIFGPSFTCIFFATSLMQSGQFSLGNWVKKIKNDLPGAWVAGAGFWPLVDLVSFSLVPMKFIPLFINICSFVWTIYLSSVANRQAE